MLLLDVRDADRTRLRYAGGLTGRRAADLADGRLLFRATGACNDGLLHVHERTATRRQDGRAIPVRIGHPWRVARHLRLDEFLLGVEGIALMRHLFDDDALAETRREEIRRIACVEEGVYQLGVDVPIVDVASGYARWSQTYDNPGNPLIQIEQPVVWSIFEAIPRGAALDAACGTGRHARRLVELGHHVVGVDASPAMLEKARAALPQAAFCDGDLSALPLEPASVDLVVCALALEHVADLGKAIAELSRVLRPGGRMVLSGLHPAAAALGGAAYFQDAAGGAGVVRGYGHLHGDYLKAFHHSQLAIRQCLGPRLGPAEAAMQGPASQFIPDATAAAYVGLPGALIWELVRG
jgi:ubiquinone/menaquinone biosynthesis C-methylase UbiE